MQGLDPAEVKGEELLARRDADETCAAGKGGAGAAVKGSAKSPDRFVADGGRGKRCLRKTAARSRAEEVASKKKSVKTRNERNEG